MTAGPLVSVLTPVYNGEAYLSECIESVLAQTYPRWEHVLVDNASSDRTGEILRAYAARDRRLRVVTNERHVAVIPNHNIAARQISPASRWCKYLSADDALLPECLERMVMLGETHPTIGVISAYQVQGHKVGLAGLPYPSPVTAGRTIARASLLGRLNVFGGATAHMIRADFVRSRDPFFDDSNLHADVAACYEVLQTSDFGFVHQVLTSARAHRGSLTFSVARRLNTYVLGHLKILTQYGPVFLAPDEYAQVLRQRLDAYYTFLARALLTPAGREIWAFHRDGLRALGFPVSVRRLSRAMLQQLRRVVLSPRELSKVARLIHAGRAADDTSWRQWWAPTGFEAVHGVPAADPRGDRAVLR
jgi:glycosyltransferase involved in cell wall biosynthesis